MKARMLFPTLGVAALVALTGCADSEPDTDMEMDETEVEMSDRESPTGFGEWDADRSDGLISDEWNAWWADNDIRSRWDMDDEEGLSREEWDEATYDLWDENDDDVVDESEWTTATDRWYGADADYGSWADWDGDGDSELDLNEVREGMEREGLYDRVDGDNDLLIDDEELADWFFDIFDADDDDEIDTTEWDRGAGYGFTR